MNSALVGSSGYIARYLLDRFEAEPGIRSVLKIDRTGEADAFLDLTCPESFDYSLLDGVDYIVFTAAVSGPDQCAKDFDACWQINVTGTKYFIREALKRNCRVLFFSSDAVFGDLSGKVYDEDSETRAQTPYGRMKKAIEDAFRGESGFKAIRLSYVASAKDRFISYCLNCARKGETAEIFHPFYRNVTVVSDVVDIVAWFAGHWDEYEPQFLNVAGPELVSRVRMADELSEFLGGRLDYTISRPEETFFKNRPKITRMRSLYLRQYHIVPEDSFTGKIRKELEGITL